MSNPIERPLFYEGEVLGAADLTTGVEYQRGQLARHERNLHLWGIASGLELSGKDKQTAGGEKYQDVTLSAGLAIDGTGREVVVPEDAQLREDVFDQSNVAITNPDALYPVFLMGSDQAAAQPAVATSACASTEPTRIDESYEILFGRPGDEIDWEIQTAPAIAAGPGNRAWRLLLGFVQWNPDLQKFKDVANEYTGIGRRYAGVQADVVAARAGKLTLRSRVDNQSGKPAILMDETDGGLLQFGLLTDTGGVTSLFSVNNKGDLTVPGTISGTTAAGTLKIESGIATDGMILPLPAGVTEKQVADGEAVIHTHIALRFREEDAPTTSEQWGSFPLESFVDTDRRVHCRIRWFQVSSTIGTKIEDHSAACHYTVLASVPKK